MKISHVDKIKGRGIAICLKKVTEPIAIGDYVTNGSHIWKVLGVETGHIDFTYSSFVLRGSTLPEVGDTIERVFTTTAYLVVNDNIAELEEDDWKKVRFSNGFQDVETACQHVRKEIKSTNYYIIKIEFNNSLWDFSPQGFVQVGYEEPKTLWDKDIYFGHSKLGDLPLMEKPKIVAEYCYEDNLP